MTQQEAIEIVSYLKDEVDFHFGAYEYSDEEFHEALDIVLDLIDKTTEL